MTIETILKRELRENDFALEDSFKEKCRLYHDQLEDVYTEDFSWDVLENANEEVEEIGIEDFYVIGRFAQEPLALFYLVDTEYADSYLGKYTPKEVIEIIYNRVRGVDERYSFPEINYESPEHHDTDNFEILSGIASNPKTPSTILEDIIANYDYHGITASQNPNTPIERVYDVLESVEDEEEREDIEKCIIGRGYDPSAREIVYVPDNEYQLVFDIKS